MQVKIEFPADNKVLARLLGAALVEYSGATVACPDTVVPVNDTHEEYRSGVAANVGTEGHIDHGGDAIGPGPSGSGGKPDGPGGPVDTKGVPFNADMCAKAKEPFYASGPHKGQWKRKKGVDEAVYDSWYAASMPEADSTADTSEVDTSSAFGGDNPQTVDVPKDCGAFMGWVSAQQAAGRLNQIDINEAYAALDLTVTDLFPPNDAKTIEAHISNLFEKLGGFE